MCIIAKGWFLFAQWQPFRLICGNQIYNHLEWKIGIISIRNSQTSIGGKYSDLQERGSDGHHDNNLIYGAPVTYSTDPASHAVSVVLFMWGNRDLGRPRAHSELQSVMEIGFYLQSVGLQSTSLKYLFYRKVFYIRLSFTI